VTGSRLQTAESRKGTAVWEALFWCYLANAVLVTTHEIDSAYWREWELFRLPGGRAAFLIIHLPLLAVMLYGQVLVAERALAGLVISLLLAGGGLFAFTIHTVLIKRGRDEFKTPVSLAILVSTLGVSSVQAVLTVILIAG
jgi:hypothetical protein